MKRALIFVVTISVYLAFLNTALKQFIADIYYESAMNHLNRGEYEIAEKQIESALSGNPKEPAYLRGKAKILIAASMSQALTESSISIKENALESLKKAESLNPKNLATLRNSIPLYYYLSLDTANEDGSFSVDKEYSEYAKTFYSYLKDTYGNDLGIIADIAEYERKLNFEKEFAQSFEKAKTLRPDIVDWHNSFIGRQ